MQPASIEQSLSELNRKVAELAARIADLEKLAPEEPTEKDWRRTLGMFADDPEHDELLELGREWRRSRTD